MNKNGNKLISVLKYRCNLIKIYENNSLIIDRYDTVLLLLVIFSPLLTKTRTLSGRIKNRYISRIFILKLNLLHS